MAGPEPYMDALNRGADVVLGGRTSDTSLFVAVPALRGIPRGVAYHAAKILECGAAAAEKRYHPDCMAAFEDDSGFTIEPPNPSFRCTPQSVAAHVLYENGDPHVMLEPGGRLVISDAKYEAVDDRSVRVTGSHYEPVDQYTLKLEGARLRGYRTIVVAGIRDPLIIDQLDGFFDSLRPTVETKIKESLGLAPEQYSWRRVTYGVDGTMGCLESAVSHAHEVGIVLDVVAQSQKAAAAVASVLWHTALHHPVPQYSGLVSNLAFPFSPPAFDGGPVYEFTLNHVLEVDDPLDFVDTNLVRDCCTNG